jgi:hypothetical protein
MTDFSLVAGDSKVIEITVTEADGSPTDITAANLLWTAAAQPFGTPLISKAGTITDGPGGVFDVSLVPSDTASMNGNFYHSAKITFADLSVSTIFLGLMAVSPLSAMSTVEQFKVRYPEFASVSTALISLVLSEAIGRVGDTWVDTDRLRAQMLLTAHILTMEGEPGRTENGAAGATAGTGLVKRDKVGDAETEFASPTASSSVGSTLSGYALTFYGQQYLEILRRNFPAIAVV